MINNNKDVDLNDKYQQLRYIPSDVQGECKLVKISPIYLSYWRVIPYTILSVILCGVPALILFWYPNLKNKFYAYCSGENATHYQIFNYDQSYTIVKKILSTDEDRAVNPGEIANFENRYLRYSIKDNQVKASQFDIKKHLKKIFETKNYDGLDQKTVELYQKYYGKGTIIIKQIPLFQLLLIQIIRPIYLFIIYSVLLWIIDQHYYYYAGLIIFTTIVVIILNLIQINQMNHRIHVMAYYDVAVNVLRSGKIVEMRSSQVVPGDIVFLKHQIKIPFDGIILQGSASINQSLITGQYLPIIKKSSMYNNAQDSQQNDTKIISQQVYEGTFLGRVNNKITIKKFQQHRKKYGIPVCVTRTNFATLRGQQIRIMSFPKIRLNTFKREYNYFLIVLFIIAILVYGLIIIKLKSGDHIFKKFLDFITITVPPGLSLSMTIGVFFAIRKLKQSLIYCISHDKVVMGGVVNFVCFDKTGTLTENHMDLHQIKPCISKQFINPINNLTLQTQKIQFLQQQNPQLANIFRNMATNHSIQYSGNKKMLGDPMEIKLIQSLKATLQQQDNQQVLYSMNMQNGQKLDVFNQLQFDCQLQRMTVIAKERNSSDFYAYVKGSPQSMTQVMSRDSIPQNFENMLKKYTSVGLRVLAIASKKLIQKSKQQVSKMKQEQAQNNVLFNGFEVFENKLKKETVQAIKELDNAQMPCVMITGDNHLTACYVAYKCGIFNENKKVLIINLKDQKQLVCEQFLYENNMDQNFPTQKIKVQQFFQKNQLTPIGQSVSENRLINPNLNSIKNFLNQIIREAKEKYNLCITGSAFNLIFKDPNQNKNIQMVEFFSLVKVYANARPNDKVRIIFMYQSLLGKSVAMCGDGSNDCGAIKQADLGLSLSQPQAPISSPFTSNTINISSMVILIKECRACLVNNFSLFNIMALYSLIQCTTTILGAYFYAYPSIQQFLYWDILCNFLVFVTIGITGTAQTLSKQKPKSSFFSVGNIVQVLALFIIQFTCQLMVLVAMKFIPNFKSLTPNNNNQEQYKSYGQFPTQNYECSSLFLVANLLYAYSIMAFSLSIPWRKSLMTNIPFIIVLTIIILYSTIMIIVPQARLSIFLIKQLQGDDIAYRGFLLGICAFSGLFIIISKKCIQISL